MRREARTGKERGIKPNVSFLRTSLQGKELFHQDQLDQRLPLARTDLAQAINPIWTYRLYFQAIRDILARDSYRLLREAVKRQLNLPELPAELQRILIYSEKHGNWYHPVKVEVICPQGCTRFVINAALTERGRMVMAQEIRALKILSEKFNYPFLPAVYFQVGAEGPPPLKEENHSLSLFLADWFEGFHEFHLSVDPGDGIIKIILWDGSPEPNYLTNPQARQIYQQISKILTLYYDPQTYEQIFPWHHGAGDFVARVNGDQAKVRLVTVRQYGPLADPDEMDMEEALLLFFLNLSIRMRLDRIDGVGEIAWAGSDCLNSTWEGFLEGLRIKEKEGTCPPGFRKTFLKDLKLISAGDLTERFSELLASYAPEAPDLPIIRKNIALHIHQIRQIVLSQG